jgi:hypothetical protein
MNFKTPHTTVQITALSTPALIAVGIKYSVAYYIAR